MASPEGSKKAILAALVANVGIAIAKFVGFLITGAASMLAEAIHSVADASNQGLLFYGAKAASRPADEEHPFGYGNRRYFWAFIVALVLFSMGGLFAIYEGIEKLRHPHELESIGVAIAILVFAILLEMWSFRTALVETNKARGRTSLRHFIRRSKSPELPVVLLEDTGALVGLVFALFGVVMARITHEPRWDAAGSLAIGVLLVVIALFLATEMASLLLGESATPDDIAEMRAVIEAEPDVLRIIHLRTEHIGPDEIVLAAKVEFHHELTVPQLAEVVNSIEHRVRTAVPAVRLIFIEPDVYRPQRVGTEPV
jgi:cation diffusion facilitator family transporter